MEKIIKNSLQKALSYEAYKTLIIDLLKQGKSTGVLQSEDLLQYSKLNDKRMKRLDKQVKIDPITQKKARDIQKDFTWLVLTESWCGDAAQTLPVINKIAEENSKINLRIVSRDENEDLMNAFLTNGSKSIPKLIVVENESNKVVGSWGPRSKVATGMVEAYKSEHGKLDAAFKKDLQIWYNKDKGESVQHDLREFLEIMQ